MDGTTLGPGGAGLNLPGLEDLRAAMRERAVVAEARVVLADRLGCHEDEALQHLIWLARDLGTELEETAALLVTEDAANTQPQTAVNGSPRLTVGDVDEAIRHIRSRADDPTDPAGPAGIADRAEEVEALLGGLTDEDERADQERLAAAPNDPAAQAVLDSALGSSSHLIPVRADDGHVVDFLHRAFGEAAEDIFGRPPEELLGRRMLRIDPGALLNGLFPEYVKVLETGEPFACGPIDYSTVHHGTSRSARLSIRCVQVPTGICLTWRHHDDDDRVRRRLDRSERLASIGFGEWDLAADETVWSPQMLANYGRGPSDEPVGADDFPKIIAPEDLPLFEQAMHVLFSRREPVQVEYRIRTPGGSDRHLWLNAEPMLDRAGRLTGISAITQDVTRRRSIEGALAETRRDLLRLQGESARERQVALTLRRAILPPDQVLAGAPGLSAAVRSIPAENPARIGGDWYVTRVLPSGRSLLAIGDASGHGLAATADMARMRHGLLGLAYTGECSGRLLGWLNDMTDGLGPATTGTAVVAHFDPETRQLTWSSAGHPPPILVRDGRAERLAAAGDPDPLLGAFPGMEYATNATPLRDGDVVVLYTDGLVERRGADLDAQIDKLAGMVEGHGDNLHRMLDDVLQRMGHDRFADDTTLFAFRVGG
ncbi:SpoIIE family protein phosphatase [Actinomadura barringtoniae]|uniref:SpoIIE family protein phosphatase n=1 Tax=Actinomadura barringtoniae TaxID=1427535 RepID=A0A939PJ07_9ACTN|nr:SpoIIE family protein phosphatase [Actinomadura barringtoniae]MBO2449446.1 SpoIIE family protein phosphatase [Actinomadura barringtoniae]